MMNFQHLCLLGNFYYLLFIYFDNCKKNCFLNYYHYFLFRHETTAHTLSWTILELSRHPNIQQKLQREIDSHLSRVDIQNFTYADLFKFEYLTLVINETLRFFSFLFFPSFFFFTNLNCMIYLFIDIGFGLSSQQEL